MTKQADNEPRHELRFTIPESLYEYMKATAMLSGHNDINRLAEVCIGVGLAVGMSPQKNTILSLIQQDIVERITKGSGGEGQKPVDSGTHT